MSDSENEIEDRNKTKIERINKLINDINILTDNDFTSVEDCLQYVKYLYNEIDTKSKKENRTSRALYDEKIEKLQDQYDELSRKLKSTERKYKKIIENKEDEITDLKEQIESEQENLKNNCKCKSQLNNLKETISDLENKLEFKTNKIDDLEKKNRILETEKSEFESTKNQIAIENSKKILENEILNNENLNVKLAQSVVDLDECQNILAEEKNKNVLAERKISLYEKKLNKLKKIQNIKLRNNHKELYKENWYPNWWNYHIQ